MKLHSILSNSFFGCKKFLYPAYLKLIETHSLKPDQVLQIFAPYSTTLPEIKTQQNQTSLLDIFAQFIENNALVFINWSYEKLSTWLEICAHVFEYSFEKHLSKKQSFEYFSQVMVRHSLFRPPHCVDAFNYQEASQLTDFWIENFIRFYQQYFQCFQAQLNQILYVVAPASPPLEQLTITKKEISREDFKAKFGQLLQINDALKKSS